MRASLTHLPRLWLTAIVLAFVVVGVCTTQSMAEPVSAGEPSSALAPSSPDLVAPLATPAPQPALLNPSRRLAKPLTWFVLAICAAFAIVVADPLWRARAARAVHARSSDGHTRPPRRGPPLLAHC